VETEYAYKTITQIRKIKNFVSHSFPQDTTIPVNKIKKSFFIPIKDKIA